jgi:hypothetical protein
VRNGKRQDPSFDSARVGASFVIDPAHAPGSLLLARDRSVHPYIYSPSAAQAMLLWVGATLRLGWPG